MTETFYDLLGVTDDATAGEIEQAYRDAVKEVHPDVSDDVDASERTARLNKAKDVLTDEAERARYDRLGHESYTSGAGAGSDPTTDRSGAGENDAGGPTVGSNPWESDSGRGGRERSARRGGKSASARRQAAASTTPGPNVEGSWNAWETTRAWAVHRDAGGRRGFHPGTLFAHEEPLLLLAATFFLYPMFVFSAVVPAFPVLARLFVAVCTLCTVVYLLSMPEAAVVVFGLWSVLVPLALVVLPGVGVLSLVGVVGLVATWLPFGFAVLTYSVVKPH